MDVSIQNLSSQSLFTIGFELGNEYLYLLQQDILVDRAIKWMGPLFAWLSAWKSETGEIHLHLHSDTI